MEELAYKPDGAVSEKYRTPRVAKQDFLIFLMTRGKLVIKNGFANVTANKILYTVPVGKELYITNVSLTGDNDLGAASDSINIRTGARIFFEMYVGRVLTEVQNISLNPPILLHAGDKITIYAGASCKAIGSFVGYEISVFSSVNP